MADSLSRALTSRPESEELLVVNKLKLHPIQDDRLAQICNDTADDITMMMLATIFGRGWPNERKQLPDNIKPFFDY